jgi:hypothetical protein
MDILMKKIPPTASYFGYPNSILYFGFLASQEQKRENDSTVQTRYRKIVGE